MNFREYEEMLKTTPYPETLEFAPAILWPHLETVPLGVTSIGGDHPAVVRIPARVTNHYGLQVPVIAIRKDVFADHDRITDIVLPPTVEGIPMGAFAGCTELRRITIPRAVRTIREGTFAGCDLLEDVYYEGSMDEWRNIRIVHDKHEIEFGTLIPGTPVQEVKSERLVHVPGNDALLTANIHFHCAPPGPARDSVFVMIAGGKDITRVFRTM